MTFSWAVSVMLFCFPAATPAATISGIVKDVSGAVVPAATVEIRSAGATILAIRQTNEAGRFDWNTAHPMPGYFQLRVRANGFATRELQIYFADADVPVEIVLHPRSIFTQVVVTATRGSSEEFISSPHLAVIKDMQDSLQRPFATIGHVLDQEPGLLLQQSAYGQVSPFLRGLTGHQVLNLVDGIRFNNSTFRSGPNQYLAFVEPTQADRVEAVLGPTGSQYGSDSLGGTIQVLTPEVRFREPHTRKIHGDFAVGGATADFSSYSSARFSIANDSLFWLGGVSGRRHNDLRAGYGQDSHNVFHRFLGLPLDDVRNLVGNRQQDSGFQQYGVQTKFAARFPSNQSIALHYQRGRQDGVRGYKDLQGGMGRLVSAFDPQGLNWFNARYEKLGAGVLDSISGTFSLNSQTDGTVRQGLLYSDPITRDLNRVTAYGYTGQGSLHGGRRMTATFGGEVYDERIASEREVLNPATNALIQPRPLYPNGSRYWNLGLFGQAAYQVSSALRAAGGIRLTQVGFKTRAQSSFGIPGSSLRFSDLTFHASIRWQPTAVLGLHGVASRGFRAPNLNDLGALGLNDLGYEIPAAEVIQAQAWLSTDAGEGALSKAKPVRSLTAESLMNYELGLSVSTRRLSARMQCFDAELYNPIVRRTLLFSATHAPAQLAGLPVTPLMQTAAQKAQGVVAVVTEMDPRAVKAFVNDGRSRYYGIEALARLAFDARWSIETNYSYIVGRELNPNRNIRRLPPQTASATLRFIPSNRQPWFEVSLAAAGRQDRLSGGDRDDERMGASFRRQDMADFFWGSRMAPYRNGDVFLPTRETLKQIQDRVLPIGALVNGVQVADDSSRVPLYLFTPGWAALSIRAGFPLSEGWQLVGALENVLDRNYRYHGSGIDAPGVNGYLTIRYRF